jgi:hypothetical protein|tara:strand:- start:3675 stop:3905 length:231 start_codon:yes stop_codon:yes gene_type:complete
MYRTRYRIDAGRRSTHWDRQAQARDYIDIITAAQPLPSPTRNRAVDGTLNRSEPSNGEHFDQKRIASQHHAFFWHN